MDIKMPTMDGYEATQLIKKMRPHLSIIAQTAYTTHEDQEMAMDAGCDDYLSKPFRMEIIYSKIRTWCND